MNALQVHIIVIVMQFVVISYMDTHVRASQAIQEMDISVQVC